ncbi:bidirectional sugar transporter SWEET3a-like [Miscanthus floridulus]|uniref:bidirectional sugar transporter SWEET3a-like n=1 Tax=Miscanthus floridulus TaxID=154761 RepID=UPI003458B57F
MITSIRVIVVIIGSVVCIALYAVPMLTFKRVIKEASVGEFSCVPYILALFSTLTYSWYGFPVVSSGWENLTASGTCLIGVLFQIWFISLYLWFAPRQKKVVFSPAVSLVLAIFCVTVFTSSFIVHTHHLRKVFVGSIGIERAISMYSSPLVAVKQVIRTKSVEFMPFYLSLFYFLASLIWMIYGILGRDPYISRSTPNAAGCFTGILQLAVYCIYSRCKEPTKILSDIEQANDMAMATKP